MASLLSPNSPHYTNHGCSLTWAGQRASMTPPLPVNAAFRVFRGVGEAQFGSPGSQQTRTL